MSITVIAYSKTRHFNITDCAELLSMIPFCDGKSFTGTATIGEMAPFKDYKATALTFEDTQHHSDHLYIVIETVDHLPQDMIDILTEHVKNTGCLLTDLMPVKIGYTATLTNAAQIVRESFAAQRIEDIKLVN